MEAEMVIKCLKDSLKNAISYAEMLPRTDLTDDIKFDMGVILQKLELNCFIVQTYNID